MSLLFPLYLAGLAAIGAPIIFHLIRRTPSGRTRFSTLMFLRTSPPRMVKRKNLDNLPLLCLRGLILILLATAFARPFLRSEERVEAASSGGVHVAVLIDTSASMRHAWQAALGEARAALAAAPARAQVALASFDRGLRWHVRPEGEGEPDGRRARVRASLDALSPGWAGTDLGQALSSAADHLGGLVSEPGDSASLVVVTDLQMGARLTGLDDVAWPAGVRLEVRTVAARGDNAGLHPVPRERGDDGTQRVRISNAADSSGERFELRWSRGEGLPVGEAVTVLCPAGESRVVRAPARPLEDGVDRLVLSGDARPFDNVLFDRPPVTLPLEVQFVGAPDPDPRGLDFFLEHAAAGHPTRAVTLTRHVPEAPPALDPLHAPLVVVRVGDANPAPEPLIEYARAGGVVLAVLETAAGADFVGALLDDPEVSLTEGEVPRGHALLGEVDFDHPLFQPFADPRYRNFTGVRFWRRRALATTRAALVSFEDGAPFLVERPVGDGRVLVMTSSWAPADGDLARSTRFASLVQGTLRLGGAHALEERYRVGDPGVDTSTPGHHELERDGRVHRYTVLLDPEESRTAPGGLDVLERFEVPVTTEATNAAQAERTRQEQVRELEQRQQLWRWLVLAALAGLLVETLWAGRLARRPEGT